MNQVSNTSRPINLPLEDLLKDMQEYNKTCLPMMRASFTGDWQAPKVIIDARPELVRYSVTPNKETILHLVVAAEPSKPTIEFLDYLLNMMEKEDTELEILDSNNALHVAVTNGSMKMVEKMVNNHEALLRISNRDKYFPITLSAFCGHHAMTSYLYDISKGNLSTYMDGGDINFLLHLCINGQMFDITFNMLRDFPDKFSHYTYAILLHELARRPFNRPEKQNIIWKNIDRVLVKLHMKKGSSENDRIALMLLQTVLNTCSKFTLEEQLEILKGPYDYENSKKVYRCPSGVLFVAVEMGNTAFVVELVQVYPHLITKRNDHNDDTIFHVAIEHRHRGIYNLMYQIGERRMAILTHKNKKADTVLHVLAKSSKDNQLENTSGASLLVQRELLWFLDVEKMLPPALRESKNNDGQTAHEIFFPANRDVIAGGLKWMKDCMVTTALIVTIGFAVAFTVPGGYNQETGFPIFLHERSFLVFVIADAISLFFSSASLLVFLSILTSHHGQRDFLRSLPMKLMIGLLTLFISVVAMMVTFAASFFVLYHNGLKWVPIILSIFSAMPIILFVALQLPVWSDMFRSTFDRRYLFNPRSRMLYNSSMV